MKYSGALCSGLELHRQYFQEHHNKFESLTFQKIPSITSGTSTPQSFRTSLKNARSPHVSSTKQGSVSVEILFLHEDIFISPPSSLWPSEPPAQSPLHFTAKRPCGTRASKSWEFVFILGSIAGPAEPGHETILREIITSDPIQKSSKAPGGFTCHTDKTCK